MAPVSVVDTSSTRPPFENAGDTARVVVEAALASTPPVAATASTSRRGWMAGAAGAMLVGAAGVATWRWRLAPDRVVAAGTRKLAVLPFKPIATGAGDEPLEVGMAESLVLRL